MIPIAHILARRRYEARKAQQISDQSPHRSRPIAGLRRRRRDVSEDDVHGPRRVQDVGTAVEPAAVYVDIYAAQDVTIFKLMFTYDNVLSSSNDDNDLDFYFPISECGRVKHMDCTFNRQSLHGELIKVDDRVEPVEDQVFAVVTDDGDEKTAKRRGGKPSADSRGGSGPGGVASSSPPPQPVHPACQKKSDIFSYIRVPFVEKQMHENGADVSKRSLDIFIECHVKTIEISALERYRIVFPLLVLPKSPASVRCEMVMPGSIRRVWLSHTKHHVFPTLFNERAEFSMIFSPSNPLRLEEYLLDVEIELGRPIVAECIDPVSLLIVVSAALVFVFVMLTKDLHEVDIF